jgi:hypothetical protein
MFVDGNMRVDGTIKTSPNGRTNWIFVPLSEKNFSKAKSLFKKPLALRFAKMKHFTKEINVLSEFAVDG